MDLTLLTTASPGQDPSALWAVQLQLLALAENTLGHRDVSKVIYQPVFADDGPYIRNTPNLDGAFAELSRNAEGYWPTVINELAHETVHLLNPKPGIGNWLSEGIAVAFSVYAQIQYNLNPQRIGMQSYRRALQLVSDLPDGPLASGWRIRANCGALNNATPDILETLFKTTDPDTLVELCKQFERGWSGPTNP